MSCRERRSFRHCCSQTCAVICSRDLISALHSSSWEIIYFRNLTACKATSGCLKEGNKATILPSDQISGNRPQPWPAAPAQPAMKLKPLPAQHKARGARVLFPALGHFTCSRSDPSPSPGQKGKAVGMELTPRGRLTPGRQGTLNSLGAGRQPAAETPHWQPPGQGVQPQTSPILLPRLPRIARHHRGLGWPAPEPWGETYEGGPATHPP